MKRVYYNVRPRYTPGSPAMVSAATAIKVAQEERDSYRHCLEGVYGKGHEDLARSKGLGPQEDEHGVMRSIAEEVEEHRDHWCVVDLLTSEVYARPFPDARPGWANRSCPRCTAIKEMVRSCPLTTP